MYIPQLPSWSSHSKSLLLPCKSGGETYRFNASANDIQKDIYGKGQQSEFIWRCHIQTAVSHWPLKENQLYRAYWLRECQCNTI